ncbi:Uncharacterized protein BM_BM18569 [Brugia malayi]|uniref:Uncharacterized protein n=1 Tax=Brugia malayi TaxID=6279 RepID=A0A4E9F872_BRUMA|nr:Uncharacterized protein BM_BM18569 [Brugia malayi]VIO92367.1 Uncharacterized protein BM_BM18569 [Brugia malayi]
MHADSKLCIMLLIISVSSGNLFNDNQTIVVRAGSAAYPRYLRRNLNGCSPDDIMSHCLKSNDRYDECTRELCSRCILQASVLNPFADYCYWMMSCLCTVTSCQDLSQSECY